MIKIYKLIYQKNFYALKLKYEWLFSPLRRYCLTRLPKKGYIYSKSRNGFIDGIHFLDSVKSKIPYENVLCKKSELDKFEKEYEETLSIPFTKDKRCATSTIVKFFTFRKSAIKYCKDNKMQYTTKI